MQLTRAGIKPPALRRWTRPKLMRRPFLALMMRLALLALLCVEGCAMPTRLLELRLRRGGVLGGLGKIEAALEAAHSGTMSALVLSFDALDEANTLDDAPRLASKNDEARETLQRREAQVRQAVSDSPVPVIAIGDGRLTGAAAALFLSASFRVCTQRTAYALEECHVGLSPAFGALGALAVCPQPRTPPPAACPRVRRSLSTCSRPSACSGLLLLCISRCSLVPPRRTCHVWLDLIRPDVTCRGLAWRELADVAMALALGAVSLTAHDLMALGYGTHYVRAEALPQLLDELRAAPTA
jgi:hypothetical protein